MPKIDRILQKDILAIMLTDIKTTIRFKRVISPSYFSVRPYRFLCKRIFDHIEKYDGELPTQKSIKLDLVSHVKDLSMG